MGHGFLNMRGGRIATELEEGDWIGGGKILPLQASWKFFSTSYPKIWAMVESKMINHRTNSGMVRPKLCKRLDLLFISILLLCYM